MKRPIFNQPSVPIEIIPRSKEEYKAELIRLSTEEQRAQESLREILGEIDTKKATKSQLETNILQLQDKERKALKRAGDAKEICDGEEEKKKALLAEIETLRAEKQLEAAQTGKLLVAAEEALARTEGELEKNNLLKRGLLFVSFYIQETLALAKEKLNKIDALSEAFTNKNRKLDQIIQSAIYTDTELKLELSDVRKEKQLVTKEREEVEQLKQQNIATEEELKIERIAINKEKRSLKING